MHQLFQGPVQMKRPSTLEKIFSRQILRWSLLGLLGGVLISLALVAYLGVTSTQERLRVTADAAAKAFRPQLLALQDAERIELQIHDAFHLSGHEGVAIRGADFKRKYELGAKSETDLIAPACQTPGQICWHPAKFQVSTLVPIYFDDRRESLFGYLELSLSPHFDFPLLIGLFAAICVGSLIQAVGLSRRFVRLAGGVGSQLNEWADHIRSNPKAPIVESGIPYEDLKPLGDALSGLNQEIVRLETQARESATLSIIRGVGHDILSPVSQIQNHLKTLSFYAKDGKPAPEEILSALQRGLKRLAAIAQHTKLLQPGVAAIPKVAAINLAGETATLLEDLRDGEIASRHISLRIQEDAPPLMAKIPSEDYARIVDNLIRNAIHATPPFGRVEIVAGWEGDVPVVRVSDNGAGIPTEIQSRVFDLDFTTRPGVGTGLGLSIVKQLCERNGAEIRFRSEVGVGTEFHVRFQPVSVGKLEVAAV
jgi:signal transduction histidine kinase